MIRIILLTGFLGSGKTTLLERLLNYYQDTPVGLIVNEFGEINVDARLLEQDGITTAELSNGSIFCACIKENFIKALIELSAKKIDYLFIEASGLADPSNMDQILQAIEHQTVYPCRYAGSICVLDGEAFPELYALLPAVQNQLTYASAVIVNKEDLMDSAAKANVEEAVKAANPSAPIYFTSYCNIDISRLTPQLQPSEAPGKESTNSPETRPQTYILKLLPSITMEEFQSFLAFIAPFTYRIKGFAKIGDAGYSVSCVRSHVMVMPWNGTIEASEIVLISSVGIGLTGAIADGIGLHAPRSLKL